MEPNLGVASGWAGAGLLGLVLAWLLFKHLPAKDEQLKQIFDTHTKDTKETVAAHTNSIKEIVAAHTNSIKEVVEDNTVARNKLKEEHRLMLSDILAHCHTESKGLTNVIEKEMESLSIAITTLSSAVNKMDDHVRYMRNFTSTKKQPVDKGIGS